MDHAIVDKTVMNKIKKLNCNYSKFIIKLLLFFSATYKNVFKFNNGPPLHDPCAVAYAIDSTLFETQFTRVDIETSYSYCRGRTICDIYGGKFSHNNEKNNVLICKKMNVNKFWK